MRLAIKVFTVYYYYSNLEKEAGLYKGQEIAEDIVPSVMMEVYNRGLSVMLKHSAKNNIFGIDKGPSAFKQR